MRARRRRAAAGLLLLAGAAALVVAGVILWRHAPRPPPPMAWNRLAAELIADEFDRDRRWNPVLMSQASTPRTPDQVAAHLKASVDSLDSRWFARGWNDLAPGQLPALKAAASAYARAYREAHATPQITAAFDGQGLPAAETVTGPSETAGLLARLAQLRRDLQAASAPWSGAGAKGPGLDQADRLRAILAARERLAASDAALLQLAAAQPAAAAVMAGAGGEANLQRQVQALTAARAQAVADLAAATPKAR